jgi:hypothetical protein
MTRKTLFVLAVAAAALAGCDGAGTYSTGNQRAIDADIAAAHGNGATLENQNIDQVTVLPSVTVPFPSAY